MVSMVGIPDAVLPDSRQRRAVFLGALCAVADDLEMSWQTTIAGMACIGIGAFMIISGKSAIEGAALIAAGLGLWRAKDANVSSTLDQVQAATIKQDAKDIREANKA